MTYKVEQSLVDHTLGFPVVINDAPKRKYRGEWTLDISPDALASRAIRELIASPRPWTGEEVLGVRKWLRDTTRELGRRLGVSHAAVCKWQDAGSTATAMTKGNEYMLRLEAARNLYDTDQLEAGEFVELAARAAEFDPEGTPTRIGLDGMDFVDENWGDGQIRSVI